MKQFLLSVFFFLLPIAVLLYPLDVFLSRSYRATHRYPGELEVWNAIYDGSASCDVAIYGSSRAWVQIDPSILEDSLHSSVYNFGMDGQNFVLQYVRHKEFVRRNPFPKRIVLSVDVFSLTKKQGIYEVRQFLPFVLWNKNMAEAIKVDGGFKTIDAIIPLIRYSGYKDVFEQIKVNWNMRNDVKPYRTKGFRGMDKHWTKDFEKASKENSRLNLAIDENIKTQLLELIQDCKSAGSEIVLVYCPEHHLGQGFVSNRQEILATFNDIAAHNNITFLDYSNMAICSDTTYFYNASHLNSKGSQIFSQQLAHDLKR
jgi:hypothetical protein